MKASSGWMIALRLLDEGPRCGDGLRLLPGGNDLKTCTTCGETQPLFRFPQNGREANGALRFKTQCRTCINERDTSRKRERTAERKTAKAGACHA